MAGAYQAWSLDFVSDELIDGRRFQTLTIIDVFTRESRSIDVGSALQGMDVAAHLAFHQSYVR